MYMYGNAVMWLFSGRGGCFSPHHVLAQPCRLEGLQEKAGWSYVAWPAAMLRAMSITRASRIYLEGAPVAPPFPATPVA